VPIFQRGEPSARPTRTLTGQTLDMPEDLGTVPRRARLMLTAVQILASEDLAQPHSIGIPLGDNHGMEVLVERIRPIFKTESSLIRWVAYRGALTFIDMAFETETEWRAGLLTMGIEVTKEPFTGADERRVLERPGPIGPAVKGNILGLAASMTMKLADYQEIAAASVQAVNADPRWHLNDAMALDYIAWAAIILLRTGKAMQVYGLPQAGLLEFPGWYADPLFAKAERYWDGTDWTSRMRVLEGRRWHEHTIALRP
jgi:hypothetical protein